MKIRELCEDLRERDSYKNFIKENPNAFFCSGIFILGDSDKVELNFFIPSTKKISSFSVPFGSITNYEEIIESQEEIKNLDFKVDLDNLKEFIENESGKAFCKIIAVLRKDEWNLTCLNGLEMIRIIVNIYTGEITKKEKGNLMDMIRFQKGNRKQN